MCIKHKRKKTQEVTKYGGTNNVRSFRLPHGRPKRSIRPSASENADKYRCSAQLTTSAGFLSVRDLGPALVYPKSYIGQYSSAFVRRKRHTSECDQSRIGLTRSNFG